MYIWEIDQLMWDPSLDLDQLTKKYCRLAYGNASAEMQEYYRLIQSGWDSTTDYVWYISAGDTYIQKFIMTAGIADQVLATLSAALSKVSSDSMAAARIQPIYKTMQEQIAFYSKFVTEDGKAYYSDAGKETIVSDENLNTESGPWSTAIPLKVFKDPSTLDNCPYPLEVRLLWDETNIYVAYVMSDKKLNFPLDSRYELNAAGTWWNKCDGFFETYLWGNITNLSQYPGFYTDPVGNQIEYWLGGIYNSNRPYAWESYNKVVQSTETADGYWMNVLVVPFSMLGATWQDAHPCGTFISNYGFYGWCGSSVWSSASFRPIELVGGPSTTDKSELQSLYDANAARADENYTNVTWQAFDTARANALAVLNEDAATQQQVDDVASSLEQAVTGLTKRADKSLLQPLYDANASRTNENYTDASWQAFVTARANALAVMNEDAATQQQVDDAASALEQAAAGLITPEQEALLNLIQLASTLNKADYHVKKWADFQITLNEARNIFQDKCASAEKALQACDDLTDAIIELQGTCAVRKVLSSSIQRANDMIFSGKYADESLSILETALTQAETVYNTPIATHSEVVKANCQLLISMAKARYIQHMQFILSMV